MQLYVLKHSHWCSCQVLFPLVIYNKQLGNFLKPLDLRKWYSSAQFVSTVCNLENCEVLMFWFKWNLETIVKRALVDYTQLPDVSGDHIEHA